MGESLRHRQPAPPLHGGDLDAVRAAPGAFTGAWIDLSTGINPWPYPLPVLSDEAWTRLPGRDAEAALVAAARRAYGAAGGAVVPVPGTQAAIEWLPRLRAPSRVLVLGPTYAEHAYAWAKAGHDVREAESLPGDLDGVDVLVVAQPNNPDGRLLPLSDLRRWRNMLAARGGWLVIDEAFADAQPEASSAAEAGSPGLAILRSFGKFYGLAGLRLGFVLAPEDLGVQLSDAIGPWAVSGPALAIGAKALNDAAWQQATRRKLSAAAERLDRMIAGLGATVIGGTPLFRLAEAADAAGLAVALRGQGVQVRQFPAWPSWLRFGLAADEVELLRRFSAI